MTFGKKKHLPKMCKNVVTSLKMKFKACRPVMLTQPKRKSSLYFFFPECHKCGLTCQVDQLVSSSTKARISSDLFIVHTTTQVLKYTFTKKLKNNTSSAGGFHFLTHNFSTRHEIVEKQA